MGIKMPQSMKEVVYFTNRNWDKGSAKAWALKVECPKCKNALMGKPVEKGKVKIRSDYYICPECGFREDKKEHESRLLLSVAYVCPYCGHKGEKQTEYKRKSFKGVSAYVFTCDGCQEKIGITKKMKAPKKKK